MKTMILPALAVLTLAVCPATAQQDYGNLIASHQIVDGMTFADVRAAWGNPESVDRVPVTIRDGKEVGASQAWHYPQTIVLFKDGRVSCIHDTHDCEAAGK